MPPIEGVHNVVSKPLVEEVIKELVGQFTDLRKFKPGDEEYDLILESVREAISTSLPFDSSKLENVLDEAYAFFLTFSSLKEHNIEQSLDPSKGS